MRRMGIQPVNSSQPINFRKLILLTYISQAVFALPVLTFLVAFGQLSINSAILFGMIFSVITSPLYAAIMFLIAKGTNWANTSALIKVIGILPGRIYGLLAGGIIGFRALGVTGGIVLGVLFYLIGRWTGARVGPLLSKRMNTAID